MYWFVNMHFLEIYLEQDWKSGFHSLIACLLKLNIKLIGNECILE